MSIMQDVKSRAGETIDWDEPGTLSIVVQGGLFGGNITETALHCRHWRDLFPAAQIVLAISVSDLFAGGVRPGVLVNPPFARAFRDNSHFHSAFGQIQASCDTIILSEGALPLPPIKTISSASNNANLQIVAAQAGLAAATGRYVLRVRSDLIFSDRAFIDQYLAGVAMPRGKAAVFASRVLISTLYTLNPFTYERMPLHYSDWFHFGLLEDVRQIWAVPRMTYAEATWYKTHKCVPDSTLDERVIVPRRAVEQHILYHCFRKLVPELVLEYHNDRTSIDLTLDLLVDNFVVCDLVAANCVFDKYRMDFDNPAKALHCVTPQDWTAMALCTGTARREILEGKRIAATQPEAIPFPRRFPAQALATKIGQRNHGEIVASHANGVLLHGPYDTLPRGEYLATVQVPFVEGTGTIEIKITLDEGRVLLAEQHFTVGADMANDYEVPFEVNIDKGVDFEVVTSVYGIDLISVSALTIARRSPDFKDHQQQSFLASSPRMNSKVGIVGDRGIRTAAKAGHLLYGPYTNLHRGSYRISLIIPEGNWPGWSFMEVVAGGNREILSRQRIRRSHIADGRLSCEFTTDRNLRDVEFRVSVDRWAKFEISEVNVEQV